MVYLINFCFAHYLMAGSVGTLVYRCNLLSLLRNTNSLSLPDFEYFISLSGHVDLSYLMILSCDLISSPSCYPILSDTSANRRNNHITTCVDFFVSLL